MKEEDDEVFVVSGGLTTPLSASSTPRETNFSSSSSSSPNAANFGSGGSGRVGAGGGGLDRLVKKAASILSTDESPSSVAPKGRSTTTNGANSLLRSQQQQQQNQQRNYHSTVASDADTGVSPLRTRRQFFSSGSAPQHYDHRLQQHSSGGGSGDQSGVMAAVTSTSSSSSIPQRSGSPPHQRHGAGAPLCATSSSPSSTTSPSNHHYLAHQHVYRHYQQHQEQLQIPRGGDKSPLRSSLIKEGSRRSPSCKKTVSFSSMPAEKKISNVADCLVYMQNGCELIKVRSSTRRYRRRFTLDTDCSNLRWSPTNKKPHKAKIAIDTIREVRLGRNTENLRNSDSCFEELTEDCAFSVIWGEDYQCLDLIAGTPDEANIWVTGLMALTSGSAPVSQQLNALHQGAPTLRDR